MPERRCDHTPLSSAASALQGVRSSRPGWNRHEPDAGEDVDVLERLGRQRDGADVVVRQLAGLLVEVAQVRSVVDDDVARQILDEYHRLPETVTEGAGALFDRFDRQGLEVMVRDQGELRPATPAEHGWTEG
jgi:hypothetical protein